MTYAQALTISAHIQNLHDTGAAITAFPDAEELVVTWGVSAWDVAPTVKLIRENCPAGYFVPFVCHFTNMRVLMVKGNGRLFTVGLLATMASLSYCRTRLRNVSQDFRQVAAGFPAGTIFRVAVEAFCGQLDALTAPSPTPGVGGPLAVAINTLPGLATRAARAERTLLFEQASYYAS